MGSLVEKPVLRQRPPVDRNRRYRHQLYVRERDVPEHVNDEIRQVPRMGREQAREDADLWEEVRRNIAPGAVGTQELILDVFHRRERRRRGQDMPTFGDTRQVPIGFPRLPELQMRPFENSYSGQTMHGMKHGRGLRS